MIAVGVSNQVCLTRLERSRRGGIVCVMIQQNQKNIWKGDYQSKTGLSPPTRYILVVIFIPCKVTLTHN